MVKFGTQFQNLTKNQQIDMLYHLHDCITGLEMDIDLESERLDIHTTDSIFKQASDDLIRELYSGLRKTRRARHGLDINVGDELNDFEQQVRNLQEMYGRLQDVLVDFFDLPPSLSYSCAVKNATVHLYASATGRTPTRDRNHGHYGIDFSKDRVFVRPWGQRQVRQKSLQQMTLERFLELQKNAS